MKKIMTIMASLATTLFAFGALGDVSAPPAGFESYNSGSVFDPSVTEGESHYWYAETVDDSNIITNYTESGTSVPSLPTDVVRPDGMKENDAYPSNSNFLSLETSKPLFRSVQANSQDGTFTGSTIGDGIYLDTLVKFTASEEEFKDGALETDVDKIAIEYVDQTNDETIENPIKAFVIRAGYVGSDSLFQTNYYAYLTDDKTFQNFDVNAWHRLTVRTIANIGGNNVGFIVYLDQKPLAYDGVCGDDFSPSTDAQNYYNNEIHAVYPSAVGSGTGKNTIAAVAFSGNGAIDDVVFTTETPEFITASESVVVPFVADAGVTAISVSVAGVTDPISVVNGVATLPAQTTAFTVNVTVDTANGYTLGGISYGGTPVVDGEVTGYAGGDITVTTIRNNFNLFDENGDPIQGTFQKLSEAFAAEGVAMIKLAYDYDAIAFEGEDFAGYDIDGAIVLDLNGNDLDGGDDSAGVSLFRVADTLTIKDSVGGGSITYDTQYGYAIVQNDGSDAFIGAATGDAGATFNGKLFEDGYEGNIVKGYIDDANNADEGEFLWGSYVDGGSDYELVDDYWVVTPQGGSEPVEVSFSVEAADANSSVVIKINDELVAYADLPEKLTTGDTYEVTYTAAQGYYLATEQGYETEHGESGTVGTAAIVIEAPGVVAIATVPEAASNLVYDGTEQTGVPAGTGYTLANETATNAGEYTATATLDQGYVWEGGSTDATNIVWSIAKAPVTATVSLTVTEATYDSTKTTVTDYTTPSVNFGDAPELVENTDYTVAWSATEVTGAGTFTYTVSPVANSNYTFTETSATLTITAGGEYPTYIDGIEDATAKAAYEAKYNTWKTTYGADTSSEHEAAFLLNIDPAAADQTLEPVSITMEGGQVVISANQTLTAVNGKVYVKVATTLAGLASAEWTEVTLNEGKVQVTPGSSDTAGFYKIKVDF